MAKRSKPERSFPHDRGGKPVSRTDRARGNPTGMPEAPERTVGFALVGLGKLTIGELLPAFGQCAAARPVALVSGDARKARSTAEAYGLDADSVYSYDDFDRIADDERVEVVYIVLPNSMHREFTERAARAGKHVLCEKPMATSSADCRAMMRACREADRKLMIAYRCQYEPYNQKMIEWARERPFGPIGFVTCDTVMDVGEGAQWRTDAELSGGGSLWDIGIYSLNGARYLTGEEPTHVSAFFQQSERDRRFREIEQGIAFQMRFPSGAVASCTSSFGTAKVNRFTVMARDGWYGLEPATSYRGQRLFRGQDQERTEIQLEGVNHFAAEMDHMARCVIEGREPKTGGEEGLRDVALMELLYEAARTGRVLEVADPTEGGRGRRSGGKANGTATPARR